MKKSAMFLLAIIMIANVFVFSGCNKNEKLETTETTVSKNLKSKVTDQLYITFTVTRTGETEDTFNSTVYSYDLKNDKLDTVAVVPYTAQYPLTAYDKVNNMVYYSSKSKERHADELFSYNPATKETKMLTHEIYAINYMFPTEKGVYLGAAPYKAPVLAVRPFLYHPDTETLGDLTWDPDLQFNQINYNPIENKMIGTAFSASEQFERLDAQPEVPYEEGTNHVFLINDNTHEEIFQHEKNINILFSDQTGIWWGETYEDMNFYSFESKSNKKYIFPNKVLDAMVHQLLYITPDTKDIFFIGNSLANDGHGKTLYWYHSSTDELTTIYSAMQPPEEEMNNAFMLKK